VVGPEDSSSTDAILNESDRIVRKPPLRNQSRISVRPQLRFAERIRRSAAASPPALLGRDR
jgi:hypothetical protein